MQSCGRVLTIFVLVIRNWPKSSKNKGCRTSSKQRDRRNLSLILVSRTVFFSRLVFRKAGLFCARLYIGLLILSPVSHEMRNPLSAILQCADGVNTAISEAKGSSSNDELVSLDPEAMEYIEESTQTIILCAQHQKVKLQSPFSNAKFYS